MANAMPRPFPVGKLVDTYDIGPLIAADPGDDWEFRLRVEIWQDQRSRGRYYALGWRYEHYRIQSTFPQDENTGLPLDDPSDEEVIIGDCLILPPQIEGSSPDQVLEQVLSCVERQIRGLG